MKRLTSQSLKSKLKGITHSDTNDLIRLHRAISWVKCAEEHKENPDIKFITLWIAFNSCYASDNEYDVYFTEKEKFKEFIQKLVTLDSENLFFDILWKKFSGPVRLLIENKYAYKYFWIAQKDSNVDWETSFIKFNHSANRYLANQEVEKLLIVVLDQLYTVRNQLLHGGATYSSKVNRSQVKDASTILEFLMPVIIEIMLENIEENWGEIRYPVVES